MKNSQLNQVLKLVRRTGDKIVIMDNESEEVMVLLGLNDYEKLLSGDRKVEDLSEEELLEKINREVSLWREHNEDENFDIEEPLSDQRVRVESKKELSGEAEEKLIPHKESHDGEISESEAVDDLPDEEEEKFYLEPVE